MPQLKEAFRDQVLLLKLDEKRAVAAITKLLPRDAGDRERTLRAVQRVVSAQGELTPEGKKRLAQIEKQFAAKSLPARKKEDANARA